MNRLTFDNDGAFEEMFLFEIHEYTREEWEEYLHTPWNPLAAPYLWKAEKSDGGVQVLVVRERTWNDRSYSRTFQIRTKVS